MEDQVIIVTGATSGMGRAIATQLAQIGKKLILNGRDEKKGKNLIEELEKYTELVFVAGDVSLPETNELLVKKAISHFGKISGIITNAGVLGIGSATAISIEDWHYTFNTNFNSFFYLSKYAIPYIKKEKGFIIANASIAAFKSFPNHAAYCASKAALVSLVKQMAVDYGPEIRINAICPGPVDTPLIWDSAKAFPDPKAAVSNVQEATLLKRLGKPADIANLVEFLISEKASWFTGSAITIDGGIMASH